MISTSAPATTAPSPVCHHDGHELWEAVTNNSSSAGSQEARIRVSDLNSIASTLKDVEGVTNAMQSLRVMKLPPTADDGGNYEQQPFTSSAPVGTATASAHGPLDPVLVAGLENARERMTLLQFEDQIVRFLRNTKEPHLNFPPLSSYHRLIVHRLAQRCGLEHQTADYNPYENSTARVVTLFKTPQSAVPLVLLIDLSLDRQVSAAPSTSAPKIMMRKCSAPRSGTNGGRSSNGDKATPSLQDRERAYAEARARIFGEERLSAAAETATLTFPVHGGNETRSLNENSGLRHKNRQAVGPDGSRGFGRGRGPAQQFSENANGSCIRTVTAKPSGDNGNAHSRLSVPNATNAANWKESKVLWRNREQEMNDPDFTRNHNAFRPRSIGNMLSGSAGESESLHNGNRMGGGGVGRYGVCDYRNQQFDRSFDRSYDRPFGYQPNGGALPAPSPPMFMGSGRGHDHIGAPDFINRLDTHQYQRSPNQQYYPQQQFQHHQLNMPAPTLVGRGGYGHSSLQGRASARQVNWVPPHANIRAMGNGNSGFIDDDFPPLGK
ncbi:hypothetical protein CCR75_002390 [Bremia lactucae]|uniref:R3H domain-containing protein n=1 Tax=Bremia lactucae TaxID=4779 RepID=A0A976FLP5_BRELC|nr:hypothetical protein CCR75_002390 [Bremia lactucae]